MNFRDLQYLVAVAELAHFGKAAQRCHVSQSALSLQLQKLERDIGVQLFERTSRSVVVTEAGRETVIRARELLQQRQELIDAARHFEGSLPPDLRLGAIPTIAPYLFEELSRKLKRAHPETQVHFDERVTEELTKAVAQGQLDAGILATPVTDTLLAEQDLFEEDFLLAVPARHSLAQRSRFVRPERISDEPLLLLKDTHCLREQVLGFCTAQRVSGQRQSVASSINTLLSLVRAGAGVTLVPAMAVQATKSKQGLGFVPIKPAPSRRIRLIYRKTSRVGRQIADVVTRIIGSAGVFVERPREHA